ncbi:MAG: methyltransferase domain-containing protein [Bacteroidales bacterium]|nr:methyltransferase domain-containing protein [Bacteroidales bacterium]
MIQLIKSLIPVTTLRQLRNIIQIYQAKRLKGNTYYCPYCELQFSRMLPAGQNLKIIKEKQIIGAGFRENALCPRCYSTDRDRLIYLYLTKKSDIQSKPYKVLHFAPEKSLKKFLQSFSNISYQSGDKFMDGYKKAYYDQDVINLDLLDINKADESVDIVICNHVLEHIEDDRKAIKELFRILTPGGWGILQVPISPIIQTTLEQKTDSDQERENLFGQHDHVRLYGLDYKHRLEEIGFEVEIVDMKIELTPEEIANFAINPDEMLYLVRKA